MITDLVGELYWRMMGNYHSWKLHRENKKKSETGFGKLLKMVVEQLTALGGVKLQNSNYWGARDIGAKKAPSWILQLEAKEDYFSVNRPFFQSKSPLIDSWSYPQELIMEPLYKKFGIPFLINDPAKVNMPEASVIARKIQKFAQEVDRLYGILRPLAELIDAEQKPEYEKSRTENDADLGEKVRFEKEDRLEIEKFAQALKNRAEHQRLRGREVARKNQKAALENEKISRLKTTLQTNI